MRMIVRTALVATVAGMLVGDALAQGQGPLNTLPFATRARPKPNPAEQQNGDANAQQQPLAPSAAGPVEAAPEPVTPKAADR